MWDHLELKVEKVMRAGVLQVFSGFVDFTPYVGDILLNNGLYDLFVVTFLVEVSKNKEKKLLLTFLEFSE